MDRPSERAVGAAFFLLAKQYFPPWNGWPKSEDEIFLLAGVTQAEAYDARVEVLHRLYDLLWDTDDPLLLDPCEDVLDFEPNEFDEIGPRTFRGRNDYRDRFSQFMDSLLEKEQPPEGWTVEQLAAASGIPLKAIQGLLKSPPNPKSRKRRPPEPWPL